MWYGNVSEMTSENDNLWPRVGLAAVCRQMYVIMVKYCLHHNSPILFFPPTFHHKKPVPETTPHPNAEKHSPPNAASDPLPDRTIPRPLFTMKQNHSTTKQPRSQMQRNTLPTTPHSARLQTTHRILPTTNVCPLNKHAHQINAEKYSFLTFPDNSQTCFTIYHKCLLCD